MGRCGDGSKMNKICSKCGISKPLDNFYKHKDGKDGRRPDCKECVKKRSEKYYQEHRDEVLKYSRNYGQEHREGIRDYNKNYYQEHREELIEQTSEYREEHKEHLASCARKRMGYLSMYENKLCAAYLGIVIAERLVRHLFNDVKVMPNNHSGYDFICNKGMKIDVKSSSTLLNHGKNPYWHFNIDHNTAADFFILVAFDNRIDLNPLHLWMIPGKELNNQGSASIALSRIHKWDKWKTNIKDAQICCAELKESNHEV